MGLLALPFRLICWAITAPFRLAGWILTAPFRFIGWIPSLFSSKRTLPATIERIWDDPPPGAPSYHWVYVLFDSRGKRIKLHLSSAQAPSFTEKCVQGDTGLLEYRGHRLIKWISHSEKPVVRGVGVFLSYAHEWSEDAAYLAQVFATHGMDVWHDVDRLRVGDSLNTRVEQAIRQATYFVPLLSSEYLSSPWCVREMEAALKAGRKLLPIKVSSGELVMPPHMRQLYSGVLGEPVFLDLRARDPTGRLRELAQQMVSGPGGLPETAPPTAVPAETVPPAPGGQPAGQTSETVNGEDIETALRRLARLREDGLITAEEYEEKRRPLVDKL